MRVLVADDEEVVVTILSRYLQKWGHEVASTHDGDHAWQLFETEPFPMVITDWGMPGLNGVELIRRIRAHRAGANVYTVLLTGRSGKDDVVTGMEAGADDFLAKPFDKDELRVRVREGERIVALEQARRLAEARCQDMHALIARCSRSAELDLDQAVTLLGSLNGNGQAVCERAIAHLTRVRELVNMLRRDVECQPYGPAGP
jgi:two-component system NtrC family sensor kinase